MWKTECSCNQTNNVHDHPIDEDCSVENFRVDKRNGFSDGGAKYKKGEIKNFPGKQNLSCNNSNNPIFLQSHK